MQCSGDRQAHLRLLASLAKLVMETPLLARLRAAETPEAIVHAIEQSEAPAGAQTNEPG